MVWVPRRLSSQVVPIHVLLMNWLMRWRLGGLALLGYNHSFRTGISDLHIFVLNCFRLSRGCVPVRFCFLTPTVCSSGCRPCSSQTEQIIPNDHAMKTIRMRKHFSQMFRFFQRFVSQSSKSCSFLGLRNANLTPNNEIYRT